MMRLIKSLTTIIKNHWLSFLNYLIYLVCIIPIWLMFHYPKQSYFEAGTFESSFLGFLRNTAVLCTQIGMLISLVTFVVFVIKFITRDENKGKYLSLFVINSFHFILACHIILLTAI